ncbi:phosphoribosylformylglycinamidine synthase subunit PurQ [Planctomycetales bacterium]|nr:phosphoribosylformylglycinamidine synthase subunit PurQ [Planctomycetales bacterium]GHS99557.1 phosphoribosylformylglycinamidine synthase subunit PurQ [Planctomycetales bacterium]GHT07630.1 phosphoribosylformylglycinamidine synthase subunit PurQ [Planctomycetales bacterium]
MATPTALVLRAAGTNCDRETVFALEQAGAQCERWHVNQLTADPAPFARAQIIALPGGFTYGDDVASGKVLAVELAQALGDRLREFVERGGLVIGICNGFQVLVKTGLLPSAAFQTAADRVATLTHNDSHKFECRWVKLRAEANTVCVFAQKDEIIEIPAAHGEGKLVARSPEVVAEWERQGQVVYRYVVPTGGDYPADPNGSVGHIAGLCDRTGRIFGLMPHPERHIFPYQHPRWTRDPAAANAAGAKIFRRAVQFLQNN